MSDIILPEQEALSYVHERFFCEGGIIPNSNQNIKVSNAKAFLKAQNYSSERLKDFETGGMYYQNYADQDVLADIKRIPFSEDDYIVTTDVWSDSGRDLNFGRSRLFTSFEWDKKVLHFVRANRFLNASYSFDVIGEIREIIISYPKNIIISKTHSSHFNMLEIIKNMSHVYLNCYDDETWMSADIEST